MKFNHPTLVTITAPTCSGKSFLLSELVRRGSFTRVVSTTTRPARPGETEGVDYYFIDEATSREMEAAGAFFELIEFNRVRYGVTHQEMNDRMRQPVAPVVILEPQGLQIYEKRCRERDWHIFKIYVHVTEGVRLERLYQRALSGVIGDMEQLLGAPSASVRRQEVFFAAAMEEMKRRAEAHLRQLQSRLISTCGPERHWQNVTTWDAIVPGDDVEKAIEMIAHGVRWRNRRLAEP